MANLSSLEVSILTKVTELANRFSLKASEAEGFLSYDDDNGHYILTFPSMPKGKKEGRHFDEMMRALGSPNAAPIRTESGTDMESILDAAIKRAPGPSRGR